MICVGLAALVIACRQLQRTAPRGEPAHYLGAAASPGAGVYQMQDA
jgi:hypothetical protein